MTAAKHLQFLHVQPGPPHFQRGISSSTESDTIPHNLHQISCPIPPLAPLVPYEGLLGEGSVMVPLADHIPSQVQFPQRIPCCRLSIWPQNSQLSTYKEMVVHKMRMRSKLWLSACRLPCNAPSAPHGQRLYYFRPWTLDNNTY